MAPAFNPFNSRENSKRGPQIQSAMTTASLKKIGFSSKKIQAVERNPVCVVVTEPLLAEEAQSYKVKQVVFNVTSNDQGWTNENNFGGDYEGSWTWFDVAILRPATGKDEATADNEPCIHRYLVDTNTLHKYRFVVPDEKPKNGPFWHLQRNRRANEEPRKHAIEWKPDAVESETESLGWDFDRETGKGSGVAFVKSLEKGDRIALVARAKYSEWVNYVVEAKIELSFDGLQTPNASSATPLTHSVTGAGVDSALSPVEETTPTNITPVPNSHETTNHAVNYSASPRNSTVHVKIPPQRVTHSEGGVTALQSPSGATGDVPTSGGANSSVATRAPFKNFRKNSRKSSISSGTQPAVEPTGLVSRSWNSMVSHVKSLRKPSIDMASGTRIPADAGRNT